MIKQVRTRFILISILAVFIVLFSIIAAINVSNYASIVRSKDNLIHMLADNNGHFPASSPFSDDPFQTESRIDPFRRRNESEIPFETRYFSVEYDNTGTIISLALDNIAAVSTNEATELADTVLHKASLSGFIHDYRYLRRDSVDGTLIVFLDCSRDLSIFRSSLLSSIIVSFCGMLAVAVLILAFSKRAVRPISDSYNRQKQFITDAGHEIKTPLTIINADIDVLEIENDLSDNEWINDVRAQTKRLTELTNELVFLSKTEEFATEKAFTKQNISCIFNETLEAFSSRAILKNQVLEKDIAADVLFECDKAGIEKLFAILLDNAFKYSPNGTKVKCSLTLGKHIMITVNNTLTANSSIEPAKLFDRFYRADSSRNSENGGFGLGLSIAQAIVQQHKGYIRAIKPDVNSLSIIIQFQRQS